MWAALSGALLAAGCAEGGPDSRVDSIVPAHPAALAGAPTFVTVSLSSECWRSCREAASPVLELDTGAPLPSWLRYELKPVGNVYSIGNPGSGCIFYYCGSRSDCPGWTHAAWLLPDGMVMVCNSVEGFKLRVVADPTISPTSARLRLRIPDCGGTLLAPFTLDVVGAAQAPGMCAGSTGAPCSVDADCAAGPCDDDSATCDAAPAPASPSCSGTVLPGPSGSTCGCVAGVCSWH